MRYEAIALTGVFSIAVGTFAPRASATDADPHPILSFDHYVDHVSTVPAIAGEPVQLFVRQRALAGIASRSAGPDATGKVVLLVHGLTYPAVPTFDLPFEDYSYMAYLAQAGFDVYALDLQGYGRSTRPFPMNARCSADRPPCGYAFTLHTRHSELDDIDAVVNWILARTGATRVSLVGVSVGGARVGVYAALHPEKVDKIVLLAPVYPVVTFPNGAENPAWKDELDVVPAPGSPLLLTDSLRAFGERWDPQVKCERQYDPAVRGAIWASNMEFDPIGATWPARPDADFPGVVRSPSRTFWGWNNNMAPKVGAPTLILSGELDNEVAPSRMYEMFEHLGSARKVFVNLECTSHYVWYEWSRSIAMELAKAWLLHESVIGVYRGELNVDVEGRVQRTD